MGLRQTGFMQLIPYPGGKFYLKRIIIKMIPGHKIYVEPFAGAISVLLHKEPSPAEVINDIDDDIYNLWVQVQKNPEKLAEEAKKFWCCQKVYLQILNEWKNGYKGKDDIERAARTMFLYISGLGSFFRTTHYRYRENGKVEVVNGVDIYNKKIDLIKVVSERLRKVTILCEDFRKLMRRLDNENTFFFCDPPYFDASYQHNFSMQDHVDLAEILSKTKSKFLLTYKYDDRLLELYPKDKFYWYEIEVGNHHYKLSKKEVKKKGSKRKEVIITNYDAGIVEPSVRRGSNEEGSLFGT